MPGHFHDFTMGKKLHFLRYAPTNPLCQLLCNASSIIAPCNMNIHVLYNDRLNKYFWATETKQCQGIQQNMLFHMSLL